MSSFGSSRSLNTITPSNFLGNNLNNGNMNNNNNNNFKIDDENYLLELKMSDDPSFLEGKIERPKIFQDLKDRKQGSEKQFELFILRKKTKSHNAEHFRSFLETILKENIWPLINDSSNQNKLPGVIAIDILILTSLQYVPSILPNYLSLTLKSNDPLVIHHSIRALGHLSQNTTNLVTLSLIHQLFRAYEWLQDTPFPAFSNKSNTHVSNKNKNSDLRRSVGCMIIVEIAKNRPILFTEHLVPFFELIWIPLRAKEASVRELAVLALRACLVALKRRDSHFNVTWYEKCLNILNRDFTSNNELTLHGAFVIAGELLAHTGNFLTPHYREICDTALKFKDHKHPLIRRSLIELIPQLASFNPDLFVQHYLSICVDKILLKKENLSPSSFISLGKVGLVVKENMKPYLQRSLEVLKFGLSKNFNGGQFCPEVLQSTGMLAKSVSSSVMQDHMPELIEFMFAGGLNSVLIQSLQDIERNEPQSQSSKLIREKLLDSLSLILAGEPFKNPGTPLRYLKQYQNYSLPKQFNDPQILGLALNTLGTFNFEGFTLSDMLIKSVIPQLKNPVASVRSEAILCTSKLLGKCKLVMPQREYSHLAHFVTENLIIAGITEEDPELRSEVLTILDKSFDPYLIQENSLKFLLMGLNDHENFQVALKTLEIVCRILPRNPAAILPRLRVTLKDVIGELEWTNNSPLHEESARLLSVLIPAVPPNVILMHAPKLYSLMLPLLETSITNTPLYCAVLDTLGELIAAVPTCLKPENRKLLMNHIIEILTKQQFSPKRQVALKTLGKLCRHTNYVINPLLEYPHVLQVIVNDPNIYLRREILKVIGIIGALDPYKYQIQQLRLQGLDEEKDNDKTEKSEEPGGIETILESIQLSPDYYVTLTIKILLKILDDKSLASHHTTAISTIMVIAKNLDSQLPQFLSLIIPKFIQGMSRSSSQFRNLIFQQMGQFVIKVKRGIRPWIDDLLGAVHKYWDSTSPKNSMITLIERLSIELADEFAPEFTSLLPKLIESIEATESRSLDTISTTRFLHALENFGAILAPHLNLVIPPVVALIQNDRSEQVQLEALHTLSILCTKFRVDPYASTLLHGLSSLFRSLQRQKISNNNKQDQNYNLSLSDIEKSAFHCLTVVIKKIGPALYCPFRLLIEKNLPKNILFSPSYTNLIRDVGFTFPKISTTPLMHNSKRENQIKQPVSTVNLKNSTSSTFLSKTPLSSSFNDQDLGNEESDQPQGLVVPSISKLGFHEFDLKESWKVSKKATKEDWVQWMRKFTIALIKESPSPAIRALLGLASDYNQLFGDIFNVAFATCWTELSEPFKRDLVDSLEIALQSSTFPNELLQTLLNLCEFMDQHEQSIGLNPILLGELAVRVNAYAKALHYQERGFHRDPGPLLESLISINNELQLPESASGLSTFAQSQYGIQLKERWKEALQEWDQALLSYERRDAQEVPTFETTVGKMRCYEALGDWDKLNQLTEQVARSNLNNSSISLEHLCTAAHYGVLASWHLENWNAMREYVSHISIQDYDGVFYKAILSIHDKDYQQAKNFIGLARDKLDSPLRSLLSESYSRVYGTIVKAQQLAELEEVIQYQALPQKRPSIRQVWDERAKYIAKDLSAWRSMLLVRSLVLSPIENREAFIKFSKLCRKTGRSDLSEKSLLKLLDIKKNPKGQQESLTTQYPDVTFAWLQHTWFCKPEGKASAFRQLKQIVPHLDKTSILYSKVCKTLGKWQIGLESIHEGSIGPILNYFQSAIDSDPKSYKAWHMWAYSHYEAINYYSEKARTEGHESYYRRENEHLFPAVNGFFKTISFTSVDSHLLFKDTLRLLKLWWTYGSDPNIEAVLREGFTTVSIETWLPVIPQLIARINADSAPIRKLVLELLIKISKAHPHALVSPVAVNLKSQISSRVKIANSLLDEIRVTDEPIVRDSLLVGDELIRISVLWEEMWHEGLGEASKAYFDDKNIPAMFEILRELHNVVDTKNPTPHEEQFLKTNSKDFTDALECCKRWEHRHRNIDLDQAWQHYGELFRRLHKRLPKFRGFDLRQCSPILYNINSPLTCTIPGSYTAGKEIVTISGFNPDVEILGTKQRPRKLIIKGSDGANYMMLLKGHEDLRQDERAMQLFGLVNTLLASEYQTSRNHLKIGRYSIVPLSPRTGLIGWVPHYDTMHMLIQEYRNAHKIAVNYEYRIIIDFAPHFEKLPIPNRVEALCYAQEQTDGMDLRNIFWLKSRNSEHWLERRTNYIRSVAVMSMVGYILGLGDRHPSNLMIDRHTGKMLHIDFGDCFEVAMKREKYPEKVPFRLTRMMTNAMEISQLEGTFKSTCHSVLKVLRENKESLTVVLEAFVYDPILNWRLITPSKKKSKVDINSNKSKPELDHTQEDNNNKNNNNIKKKKRPNQILKEEVAQELSLSSFTDSGRRPSGLPEKLSDTIAHQIITRVHQKILGQEFEPDTTYEIKDQVEILIKEATSLDNLSHSFLGWCPFW